MIWGVTHKKAGILELEKLLEHLGGADSHPAILSPCHPVTLPCLHGSAGLASPLQGWGEGRSYVKRPCHHCPH